MYVHPVIQAGMKWLEQLAIHLWRDDRAVLRPKIGACKEDHIDALTHYLMDALQVLQGQVTLPIEHLVHELTPLAEADIPLLDAANAFGLLKPHTHDSDHIAEAGAAECPHHSPVRVRKPLRSGAE